MVQSPSWEANWFAASQEIPRISRNPKVHYCTHKRPPPVSILGQANPVHIHTSHFLEIHPNITVGSNSRYTMFRGGVKGTGYPLHSPVPPSLPPMGHLMPSRFNWTLPGLHPEGGGVGGNGGRWVGLTVFPPSCAVKEFWDPRTYVALRAYPGL